MRVANLPVVWCGRAPQEGGPRCLFVFQAVVPKDFLPCADGLMTVKCHPRSFARVHLQQVGVGPNVGVSGVVDKSSPGANRASGVDGYPGAVPPRDPGSSSWYCSSLLSVWVMKSPSYSARKSHGWKSLWAMTHSPLSWSSSTRKLSRGSLCRRACRVPHL